MTTLRSSIRRQLFQTRPSTYRNFLERLANRADVHFNGKRSWDMQVHDERLWQRIVSDGSLGAGEAYMDGWWDCAALDDFFAPMLGTGVDRDLHFPGSTKLVQSARLQNLQTPGRATDVARRHYDLDLDLYRAMLDRRMIYICGYWRDTTDLDDAQEAKLSLVCRKLGLEPGMRVLDSGRLSCARRQVRPDHVDRHAGTRRLQELSAGAFRARCNQLWQPVLSPNGVPGGWQTVR